MTSFEIDAVRVAPRIAEFPKVISPEFWGHHGSNLPSVSLETVHEWLASEFGDKELTKVKGLPVSAVASMYPEGEDVVFFSAVRGTTMLGELQAMLDAVAQFVALEDSEVSRALKNLRWQELNSSDDQSDQNQFWVEAPEARGLYSDAVWAINELLHGNDPSRPVDSIWFELYRLAVFVCAPVLVKADQRAEYVESLPDWNPVFTALGLGDVWMLASGRVAGWGRRKRSTIG